MTEARIRTGFGEVCITFQTEDELTKALQDLEQQAKAIQQVADRIAPPPSRSPKPGYENVYRFSQTGDLELLLLPERQNEAAALVLYAYHPDLVSSVEIERVLGLNEVARRVLAQGPNKDYFQKVDDKYGLTFNGLRMIIERMKPYISTSTEPQPKEPESTDGE